MTATMLIDNPAADGAPADAPSSDGPAAESPPLERASAENTPGTLQGRVHRLRANQALLLTSPATVWVITRGTLDVASSRFKDECPFGLRRYLFPVPQRRALFGAVPSERSGGLGLVAVASDSAEVVEVTFEGLWAVADDGNQPPFLEDWVGTLTRALVQDREPPPSLTREVEPGERERGQLEAFAVGTDGLALVRVISGTVRLLGREELTLTPDDGAILLDSQLWMEVTSPTARVCIDRPVPGAEADLAAALATPHGCYHRFLARLGEEEERQEIQRRQASKELREREMSQAVRELASVLERAEQFRPQPTPLLTAVTVVGQAQGLVIRPPAESEDLGRVTEPVDAIARASRIRWRKVLLGDGWWTKDSGPLLGFVGEQERRPVALLPAGQGYRVVDAVKREKLPLTPELRDQLCPEAYMLYPALPGRVTGLWQLLRFTTRGRGGDVLFILAMGAIATVLGMVAPRAIGTLIDVAIPSADRSMLYELAMILTGATLIGTCFIYLQIVTTVRASTAAEVTSQSGVWDRLLKLRPSFFRQYSSGELQTRVNAVSEISRQLSGVALRPLISGMLALLNFLLLWYYSLQLALTAILVSVVVLLITLVASLLIRRLSLELNDLEGDYNGLMIQMIGGVGKLRVAGGEYGAFNHWVGKYAPIIRLHQKIQFIRDVTQLANIAVPTFASGLLFWQAVQLMTSLPPGSPSRITIGDFISFNAAFALYLSGWSDVSNTLVGALDAVLKARRVRPLLEAEPEVADDAADPGRLTGHIRLEDVCFRYGDEGPLILDGLSFEVQPGEFVAFVGPSGSGKSTLLRLLLGFETPEQGRVLYDGKDLAGLDLLAVRRQIGTVLQAGRLNAGSLIDNVTNNARATNGEVWEAIADAGLTEDVQQMPMGLHTMIAEGGANLSGGQRQRVLIARSLVTRPKLVFFDEATSALDNKTQATVSQSLDRRKVTRVVIAHRLSTIRHADRIFVLQRGRVVQHGTFEELSGQEGVFKELIRRQMV